jgi:hypothetical protein
VRREQSIKTLDKLCEESKQERAKELEEEKKSFITSLKNEPLGTFFCNMVNHWDEDRASSTIFELTTRFTIGRDILIPQGIIRPSWKGFFSQLQVEIMDRGFWSFAYWMTRAYKANINDIGEYKYPDLIATIINNWEKDEAIRILKGFEMGILKLEEFAKSKDENNKVDASWLPRLVKLREEKIRDGEFWEGLSWIIKIVKLTS